ncbi:MAG: hypothetical protein JSU72_12815 [Deltaproteobacteria bacterium]|nr:MAG: hypothetical protein JSU72_12815 [Deltaproteobacteria bacterium]
MIGKLGYRALKMTCIGILLGALALPGCGFIEDLFQDPKQDESGQTVEKRQISAFQIVPDSLEIRSDEQGLQIDVSDGTTEYTLGFFGTNPTIRFILFGETTTQTFELRENDIVIERPGVNRTDLTVETRAALVLP